MIGLFSSIVALCLLPLALTAPHKRQEARVITSCTVPNTAALTFDDGPYIYEQGIADLLTANGAKLMITEAIGIPFHTETSAHQVIPYAIQKLKAAGYNLVTVAECVGMEPYQWVGTPGTPDSSWTC